MVELPENGLRLRFDGADQRLRLIEVLDFSRIALVYKGSELAKDGTTVPYKRIYQLFSASYPGEYMAPISGRHGTYVVSYPGIAFTFPLQHSAYGPGKDHVQLLGSQAASPATFMAIFEGNSWPESRDQLFVSAPSGPRNAAITNQPKDALPAELEMAFIDGTGVLTIYRRAPAQPFVITLGETTPQDLVTELGPPEATHKRDVQMLIEPVPDPRPRSKSRTASSSGRHRPTPPSSYSSTGTDTFDTDFDSGDADDDLSERASRDIYWCYFSHGVDILIGPPSDLTTTEPRHLPPTPLGSSPRLVVRKVIIHGNVPGSYVFNRHRRLRWTLALPDASHSSLTSEQGFEELRPDLLQAYSRASEGWPAAELGRGKVVNRTWGGDASDSTFFLPDADRDLVEGSGSEQWLGNTKLYAFPGLTFEVLRNGAISALTVA